MKSLKMLGLLSVLMLSANLAFGWQSMTPDQRISDNDGDTLNINSDGTLNASFGGSLPAGTNTIGKADQGTGGNSAWKVDGSAVTQPISGSISVSNFPASQTISGTITANQGGTWTAQPGNTQNTTHWLTQTKASYANITSNTTTTVKSGAGILHSITINTRGSGTAATLYDNTAGSGTKIGTLDTTLSTTAFIYDTAFSTGLTIVTAGVTPADLTISYV